MNFVPAVTDEAKALLAAYVGERCGTTGPNLVGSSPFTAAAIVRGDKIAGAVVYNHYRQTSIELSWAGDRGWATRAAIRAILAYPFIQLGVLRCWGIVRRENSEGRSFAARLGFREAGVLEDEYGLGKDGILYSMTRQRCRWLSEGQMQ